MVGVTRFGVLWVIDFHPNMATMEKWSVCEMAHLMGYGMKFHFDHWMANKLDYEMALWGIGWKFTWTI